MTNPIVVSIGQKTFQFVTILAPFLVPVLYELQRQLAGHTLDLWSLASLLTGAIISVIVAVFHIQRTATVAAQNAKELDTKRDQDQDSLIEQVPPPKPGL